ncbi:MAG: hypothetical protein ABR936_04805 [Bacteroidota bacterium]|jgi:hypothetical protein
MDDLFVSHDNILSTLNSEYIALKYEQTARISLRETALGVNFLAASAIAAVAFNHTPPNMSVLLFIPLISSCICWVYINNDLMVTKLRIFFKEEFPKRVLMALNLENSPEAINRICQIIASWETYHREEDRFRKMRRFINLFFILVGYVGISLGCVILTYQYAIISGLIIKIIWAIDLSLLLAIASVLFITRDV